MVAEAELAVRLRRLQVELRANVAAMRARAAETRELDQRWESAGALSRPELVLVAVNLHGWYTAAETAYDRVARLLDQAVPAGAGWHADLLSQMRVDVPGLRPAVIPMEVTAEMQELRKFRHFFRNAYVLELDPRRVRDRVRELLRAHPAVEAGLVQLDEHVERVLTQVR